MSKGKLGREARARLPESEREAAVAAEIARTISASLDLCTVLQRVAEGAKELCGSDIAKIALRDPRSEAMVFRHRVGSRYKGYDTFGIEAGKGSGGQVLLSGRPFRTENYVEDPRISKDYLEVAREEGVVAEMVAPIRIQERVEGLLFVQNRSRRPFTDRDEAILLRLADHAAIAIQNARLYEETEKRRRAAESLAEVGRLISQSLDPEEVEQRVVDSVRSLLGATVAALYRLEPESGDMVAVAISGDAGPTFGKNLVFPRGTGAVGLAVREGRPVVTTDLLTDPRITLEVEARTRIEQAAFRAGLAVPLVAKERVIGALGVADRPGRLFDREDIRLAQAFADQAAIALENSRLYGDLKAALDKIEAAQQQIVQAERLRALGEMAGGIAHDFNNVLAVIVGRAQLLLSQTDDPDLRRQLQVIEKVALDGARTVRRIQEFTRMRLARPFQPVDLNQVVEEVVEITRSRWKDEAQAKGVAYDLRMETTPLPPTVGDPSELSEALTNLVFNALDAMPLGGKITLRTGVEGDRVSVVVADTGIGMSDEVRQRIFDPFFTTKAGRGSGLGLSVVYGIIARHGGEVEVRSREGEGSAFTVRLPVEWEALEPAQVAPAPRPHRSAKILVVEDEREVREMVVDMLAGRGHRVTACGDGRSALARFEEEQFDLVVTDLGMPGISGWEVAKGVKLRHPETPVALVTGWGDQVDPDDVGRKGIDFLVAKPFRIDDLTAVVARALNPGRKQPDYH